MSDFGPALAALLADSHTLAPGQVPAAVDRTARRLGMTSATVYLADVQQKLLVPLTGSPAPGTAAGKAGSGKTNENPAEDWTGADGGARPLAIDATLAGWAYRTLSRRLATTPRLTVWLPLVDGIERIGILRITADQLTADLLERADALAALTALLAISKFASSDLYSRVTRLRPMTTAAEMVWAFLPPRTIGTRDVTSSAVLEPAYEIGGDAFDHGLDNGMLHVTVVDAMGHDLASGLSSAIALAGCRATRLAGGTLADIAATIDHELDRWLPGRLLTGIFAHLDTTTGDLDWVNCGHPPPLLVRAHHVVPHALEVRAELPVGLGHDRTRPYTVHRTRLEPGDRILVHTDGITETRSRTGELFGEGRLADFVTRSLAAGEPAPEALRRLIHTVLDHHQGPLRDDATLLLVEWHPDAQPPATS
ncbi:PP2C family protein-serine/threonine phosphatase [Kitasatospora sp. NPDC085895]|uniref:PP2C family protein-serine/threonine phosphatase n=1 Tax=Kitasatospora sp. NPDC085895 TaxID=3155057 RepID=UPI00344B10E8